MTSFEFPSTKANQGSRKIGESHGGARFRINRTTVVCRNRTLSLWTARSFLSSKVTTVQWGNLSEKIVNDPNRFAGRIPGPHLNVSRAKDCQWWDYIWLASIWQLPSTEGRDGERPLCLSRDRGGPSYVQKVLYDGEIPMPELTLFQGSKTSKTLS
jgi:hypothetical protein